MKEPVVRCGKERKFKGQESRVSQNLGAPDQVWSCFACESYLRTPVSEHFVPTQWLYPWSSWCLAGKGGS